MSIVLNKVNCKICGSEIILRELDSHSHYCKKREELLQKIADLCKKIENLINKFEKLKRALTINLILKK